MVRSLCPGLLAPPPHPTPGHDPEEGPLLLALVDSPQMRVRQLPGKNTLTIY